MLNSVFVLVYVVDQLMASADDGLIKELIRLIDSEFNLCLNFCYYNILYNKKFFAIIHQTFWVYFELFFNRSFYEIFYDKTAAYFVRNIMSDSFSRNICNNYQQIVIFWEFSLRCKREKSLYILNNPEKNNVQWFSKDSKNWIFVCSLAHVAQRDRAPKKLYANYSE